MDDPATFADRLPTPAELRNSYLRCCCFQAIPTEYRIFIHWVWDCIEEDWIPHHHQASWFPGDTRKETLGRFFIKRNWGIVNLRPTRIGGNSAGFGTSYVGYERSPFWNAWVDAYKNDFDAIVWRVAYQGDPEAEIQYEFNPWTFYRNMNFHQTGRFQVSIFRADIIYEGNWTATGKQHFHLPSAKLNDVCRERIQNQEPLLDCLCRMVGLAYDINAVTVSEDVYTLPLPADPTHWPDPPPNPPEEWTNFLCGDCEDPATPPSDTAELPIIIPPPPPPSRCQALHEYEWDCDEEEWTPIRTSLRAPTLFPPGFEIMIGLRLWRYGSTQPCDNPAPAAPTPENEPDAIVINEQCPAPCTCPEDVLSQYQIDSMTWIDVIFGIWVRYTLKNPVTITSSSGCFWGGSGTFKVELSFDGGGTWNEEDDVVWLIGCRLSKFDVCVWNLTVFSSSGEFSFRFLKKFGFSPTGTYKIVGSNFISGSATVS